MELQEKLNELAAWIDSNPGMFRAEVHRKANVALEKALDPWLEIKKEEERKASPQFNELVQTLGAAERSKRITPTWIKDHLKKYGITRSKTGANKLLVLAGAAFDAGDAPSLTTELQKSPETIMQEDFHRLVSRNDDEIKKFFAGKYKGAALQKFCKANDIEPVFGKSKGKTVFSPAKTKKEIFTRLEKMRSRL